MIVLTGLLLCVVEGQKADRTPFVVFEKLAVRFRFDGSAIIIGRDFGVADDTSLYRLDGKRHTKVGGDLKGHVTLSSKEAALDYVRLWTSPQTYWISGYPALLEPVRASDLARPLPLTNKVERDFADPGAPSRGIAPDPWLEGWPTAEATEVAHGFLVHRQLLRLSKEGVAQVVEATEHLSFDGAIVRELNVRAELSSQFEWSRVFRRPH